MELRPPICSRRFLAVLRGAFEASPPRAFAALAELLRGKKLRAWNLLCAAATDSPHYYARWVVGGEPAAIRRYCDANINKEDTSSTLILIMEMPGSSAADVEITANSVRRAFGARAELHTVGVQASGAGLAELITASNQRDWILPICAGDTVSPELAAVLHHALAQAPAAAMHYWDEDRLRSGERCEPWVKPDWDDILFAAHGGLLGAAIVRTAAYLDAIAGATNIAPMFREAVEIALLEVARAGGANHIPLIMSHLAQERPPGRAAELADPPDWPAVSIIIPMRDKPELLRTCLAGLDMLEYPGMVERIIVDNGSIDAEALRLLADIAQRPDHNVISMPGPFNFSVLNNAAVQTAKGDLLCLLNNDIEPLGGTWLTSMARFAAKRDVGAVGALLLYPDRTVQHAGVAIGLGGAAGHIQRGVTATAQRHRHWAFATRQVSAVTAACLVVDRAKFLKVGGLDEAAFAVAFNDVDLCLKLDAAGWKNVYVAEACLIHHESKSRGLDDLPEKAARFQRELGHLQKKWKTKTMVDPHFSPLFSRASEQCVLEL